ncbi:hypothetical protein Anas_08056, partial [Armadillidium nasatum]
RRSERDLPECEVTYEACNLVHKRLWFLPITERFCRCSRGIDCPLNYEEGFPANSQHTSNRGQLKFCEDLNENFESCNKEGPALEVLQERVEENESEGGSPNHLTRTSLFCKCPWPNQFVLNKTTSVGPRSKIFIYVCDELPRCNTGQTCGYVRRDTYEVYYTCSCPFDHLCTFQDPFTPSTDEVQKLGLLHFHGESTVAICTKK